MTNEQAILDRLDRIEAQLAPLSGAVSGMQELKDDAMPLLNGTVQILIQELGQAESGFQLEDLLRLMIRTLRSVRNFNYALDQMENIVDFVKTIEPLLKSSVPTFIQFLDDLEQKGVFRIINAGLGLRSKVAATYSAEDIEEIGDGLVVLLGLAKKFSESNTRALLDRMVSLPSEVDLSETKGVGAFGLLSAVGNDEVKEGLGVLMELTKALGKLKNDTQAPASVS